MINTHVNILTFDKIKVMKVAFVHDDLVQWGGAERVLVALLELFPQASIYTSVVDYSNKILKKYFADKKIETSFIQKIPGWRSFYKALLPVYPLAFEQFDFSQFDIVVSQTTRFAKSIITKPTTTHLCYCHTPPRFLWNFSNECSPALLLPYLSYLRVYDLISSKRVDKWFAGSVNAQERIQKVYRVPSKVVYPFVDINKFSSQKSFEGGYLLAISRLNSYKRVDLAVLAANQLRLPLKIVGTGPQERSLREKAGSTVEFLGIQSEEIMIKLLSGCKALIVSAEEDFGLTPLEAMAAGKPVIAYKKGGALETVIDGVTGYFFNEQTTESLISALTVLYKKGYNEKRCLEEADRFSKENFTKNLHSLISSL